jgi:hypothetical protein
MPTKHGAPIRFPKFETKMGKHAVNEHMILLAKNTVEWKHFLGTLTD